jgi:hypothetical protein
MSRYDDKPEWLDYPFIKGCRIVLAWIIIIVGWCASIGVPLYQTFAYSPLNIFKLLWCIPLVTIMGGITGFFGEHDLLTD